MNVVTSESTYPQELSSEIESNETPYNRREQLRLQRDRERGYSINVKQIVLAFIVEFVIIGLILTNIYVTVAQLPDPSTFKTVQALLFPIAMAMVELARVPLAIAVRTQPSWNIKLAALLGVLCAVAVTSNSLYSIGASSFTPRLEDTHKKNDLLLDLQSRKKLQEIEIQRADQNVEQKLKERDDINQEVQTRSKQLTEQKPQECVPITLPSPAPGAPPILSSRCTPNPVLKTLYADITSLKAKLAQAEVVLKQAQTERASEKYSTRSIDEEIAKAATEDRESIFQSQLHSLAAMLFGVDPKDVTAGQLKTLEFYLIFISSIAAAFSSTLIAMTAIRRIRQPKSQTLADLPSDAMEYLFGPLVVAIRQEAREAVAAAVRSSGSSDKVSPV